MKRMKHIRHGFQIVLTALFLTFCPFSACSLPALAAQDPANTYEAVYDMADLFTDEEEKTLSEMAVDLQKTMNMAVALVTTEENEDSARNFADRFYEDQGLGTGEDHSGVLLLIDMENRELWISTEGMMIRYLTDSRIEAILDDVYDYAADEDFFGAAEVFLSDTETCFYNGIAKDQFNQDEETGEISEYHYIDWFDFFFAVGVAGICGGIAVFSVLGSYGMKEDGSRMEANFQMSYRESSPFVLKNSLADVLLQTYVTQQVIASAKSGSKAGGQSSSLSGGGRSSTHHSSSGRSHGGGGRKF